jgi:hypothetical protein
LILPRTSPCHLLAKMWLAINITSHTSRGPPTNRKPEQAGP